MLIEANNRNAYDLALSYYKAKMEVAAGADKPYIKEAALQQVHDALYIAAFEQFDEIATMGESKIFCIFFLIFNLMKTAIHF